METVLDRARKIFSRMGKAHLAGRGVRLSHEDLEDLHVSFLGEVMAGVDEVESPHSLPSPSLNRNGK